MKRLAFGLCCIGLSFSVCYAQSSSDFQRDCDAGSGLACASLGNMYYEGKEVPQSIDKAKSYFEKACELEDARGCADLGILYREGQGVEQSYDKANELFEKACDAGNEIGCYNYGMSYYSGLGVKSSNKRAADYFSQACDMDYGQACISLGNLYRYGQGVRQSSETAIEYYEKACNLGLGAGCNPIGVLYAFGRGIDADPEKAITYYEKACSLNYGTGCSNLAYAYENGQGVKLSFEKAVELYTKACSLDNGIGCNGLGRMYENGDGVPKSNEKATEAYEKSCDLNYGKGCYNLGYMYGNITTDGTPQSQEKARALYEKSCDLKYGSGCTMLGKLGSSAEKSEEYYSIACDLNDSLGCLGLAKTDEEGNLEKTDRNLLKAKRLYVPDTQLKKYLTAVTTLEADLNQEKSISDKSFDADLQQFDSYIDNFNKYFYFEQAEGADLGFSRSLTLRDPQEFAGLILKPMIGKIDVQGNSKEIITGWKIDDPSVPVLTITPDPEGFFWAQLDYEELKNKYSDKLTPAQVDYLTLMAASVQHDIRVHQVLMMGVLEEGELVSPDLGIGVSDLILGWYNLSKDFPNFEPEKVNDMLKKYVDDLLIAESPDGILDDGEEVNSEVQKSFDKVLNSLDKNSKWYQCIANKYSILEKNNFVVTKEYGEYSCPGIDDSEEGTEVSEGKDSETLENREEESAALKGFISSCEAGDAAICEELALAYNDGSSVKQSYKKAAEYYDKACDFGRGLSCNRLGVFYLDGIYAEQSMEKANDYFAKACSLDYAIGCANLARQYERGNGVEQSNEKAKEYYSKACDLKLELGCAGYAKLKNN